MPLSKIKTSSITADAASANLSIDANTLFLDVTNNRVGVNTTSPAEALQVNSSSDSVIRITSTASSGKAYNLTSGGNGNYSPGVFAIRNVTDATTPFAIFQDNVGIGTTAASQKLEVAGNIFINTSGNPTLTVKTSGAGNNPLIRLQADTNYWDMIGVFSDTNDTLRLRYNNTDYVTVTNVGRVGIGITPTQQLDVLGTSLFRGSLSGNGLANSAVFTRSDATGGLQIFPSLTGGAYNSLVQPGDAAIVSNGEFGSFCIASHNGAGIRFTTNTLTLAGPHGGSGQLFINSSGQIYTPNEFQAPLYRFTVQGTGTAGAMKIESFGITATSGGTSVSLSTGSRFTGFIVVSGPTNDTSAGIWHVSTDSEYGAETLNNLTARNGAAYTGPATISLSTALAAPITMTVTGSGYRVYHVMYFGYFG